MKAPRHTGRTYYNEIDAKVAAWLAELMQQGLIPRGVIDTRSIEDVMPDDLRGFRQCHFFAGIGGWAYALQLAGWPDDEEIWTGSCPCQPFSSAGRQAGFADPRDLWPAWRWLIGQRRPAVVAGEQVANALAWLDRLHVDLEKAGYACGAIDLAAGGAGAFHIRQRLYFVADRVAEPDGRQSSNRDVQRSRRHLQREEDAAAGGGVADIAGRRLGVDRRASGPARHADEREPVDGMADDDEQGRSRQSASRLREGREDEDGDAQRHDAHRRGAALRVGHRDVARSQGRELHAAREGERAARAAGVESGMAYSDTARRRSRGSSEAGTRQRSAWLEPAGLRDAWAQVEWLLCTDHKHRPVEPGTFPLAHGVPARVGRLRGYGNAIVPQVAAEFIAAYREIRRLA